MNIIFFQSLKIKIEGQYYRYCMQFWLQYTAKIWIWDPQIVTAATALSSSKFGFLVAWNSTKTLLTKKLLIISSHAFSRLVDRYVMISDLVFHWLVVFLWLDSSLLLVILNDGTLSIKKKNRKMYLIIWQRIVLSYR